MPYQIDLSGGMNIGSTSELVKHRKQLPRWLDLNRHWEERYNAFVKAGFSEKEATWAANSGIRISDKRGKRLLWHRRELVDWYIRAMKMTRAEAIKVCENDPRQNCEQQLRDQERISEEYIESLLERGYLPCD